VTPPVIVFDAMCVLCSGHAQFVLRETCWLPNAAQRSRML